MHIEAYERLKLDITQFDVEDVITTSVQSSVPLDDEEVGPGGTSFPIPGTG